MCIPDIQLFVENKCRLPIATEHSMFIEMLIDIDIVFIYVFI